MPFSLPQCCTVLCAAVVWSGVECWLNVDKDFTCLKLVFLMTECLKKVIATGFGILLWLKGGSSEEGQ